MIRWIAETMGAAGRVLSPTQAMAAQQRVYVTAAGAKLQSGNQASAKTLATLPIGAALTVLATDAKWYQVSTADGKKGWIYRGKVSTTPPASGKTGQGSGAGSLIGSIGGSGISAGAADTSRSIRGLSPEAQEYAKKTGTPEACRRALDQALGMQMRNEDLDRFLMEGQIGEYAGGQNR